MKLRQSLLFLLSTENVLTAVVVIGIFAFAAVPILDTDFWWHLRTGQYIWETATIPRTDLFSAFHFGHEWVAHEWLSELFTYAIFRVGGFAGLIAIFALSVAGAFLVVYVRARQRSAHAYLSLIAVVLGALATFPTWGVRPHVLSFLLAAIFLYLLERYCREGRTTTLVLLLALHIVWVNLHAGFVVGLVLIFLTALGVVIDKLFSDQIESFPWKKVQQLTLLLIVCTAAVIINPTGLRLLSYPFETLTSPAMMMYIQEWRSPNFHEARFQAFALLLLATACSFGLSRKRIRVSDLMMFAAFGWATLRSSRNVWVFTLIAVPLLAENLSSWISSNDSMGWLRDSARQPTNSFSSRSVVNALLLIIFLVLITVKVDRAAAVQSEVEAYQFPASAIEYVRANKLPQPIFNEYDWGGYLIWKLYSEVKVYIDGRADVFGDEFLTEYFKARDGKPGWREILDRRGVKTIFLKPDTELATLVRTDPQTWQNVFEDSSAVIFVRREAQSIR